MIVLLMPESEAMFHVFLYMELFDFPTVEDALEDLILQSVFTEHIR